MGAYDCWLNQRERLRSSLEQIGEGSSATYLVRHALAQTEQDTLADIPDDTLRQQAGVLFSCLKSSAAFLDVTVTYTQWQARSLQKPKQKPFWLLLAVAMLIQVLFGLHFYTKGETVIWITLLIPLLLTTAYLLLRGGKKSDESDKEVRVTLRPDTEKLLSIMDAQLRALDRFLSDMAYLNEALGKQGGQPAAKLAGVASEMLEALYECDTELREQALPAAEKLLGELGMEAVDYSVNDRRLFTELPSKQETRTLVPALVSVSDRRLLRVGTAAVEQAAQNT